MWKTKLSQSLSGWGGEVGKKMSCKGEEKGSRERKRKKSLPSMAVHTVNASIWEFKAVGFV